ncbi:MAG: hypothetical protein M1133_16330 [Armatimonadetes bacterium]|nr:hypothetical protein [Armatimonadota bacterium]
MKTRIPAAIMTFLKFMIYSTAANLATTMPSHDNPLFWKLFGASLVAALIKALLTYATTAAQP